RQAPPVEEQYERVGGAEKMEARQVDVGILAGGVREHVRLGPVSQVLRAEAEDRFQVRAGPRISARSENAADLVWIRALHLAQHGVDARGSGAGLWLVAREGEARCETGEEQDRADDRTDSHRPSVANLACRCESGIDPREGRCFGSVPIVALPVR